MEHELEIFIATREDQVPDGVARFASVDGTVPGFAVRWDHHVTGERVNLDAMPEVLDTTALDGVGTTLLDADAVCSAAVVLLGGKGRVRPAHLAVMEAASHWCDHLVAHPDHGEEVNRLGRGLLAWVHDAAGAPAPRTKVFAALSRELAAALRRDGALPWREHEDEQVQRARALRDQGRLREVGGVALLDLRGAGRIDLLESYRQHRCPVAVVVAQHRDGGLQFTVGVNPTLAAPLADLSPALAALAAAEYAHGAPCRGGTPVADAENWGGRATVFGSPWNYGSRLQPDEVVGMVGRAMKLEGCDA